MRFSKISSLFLLALALGCGPGPDRLAMLQTSMGNMQVRLYAATPEETKRFIRMASSGASLAFSFVERDFIIEAGLPGRPEGRTETDGLRSAEPTNDALALRGTLAMLSEAGGKNNEDPGEDSFFIVVGQVLTESTLNSWEKRLGFSFSPEQRRRFLERGGLPALTGQCIVFGEIEEGMEVAERIAALPRQTSGRPLQHISLKIKFLK